MNRKSGIQSGRSHEGCHAHDWNRAKAVKFSIPSSGFRYAHLKILRLPNG